MVHVFFEERVTAVKISHNYLLSCFCGFIPLTVRWMFTHNSGFRSASRIVRYHSYSKCCWWWPFSSLTFMHGYIEIQKKKHKKESSSFLSTTTQWLTYNHPDSTTAQCYAWAAPCSSLALLICIFHDSEHHGSLNICSTISVPTFKMEEESCAARSRWIPIKPLCKGYVFATDHTACYHDNKQKFPSIHFNQVLSNTETILPSPPSKLLTVSLLPASQGV